MKFRELFLAAAAYVLSVALVFAPFLFLGLTFLPVDLHHMLYKPYAAAQPVFAPFNHFDDDILKYLFAYMRGARDHLYQPYWESGILGGFPMYATSYASHFSPLNWILPLGPLHVTYPLRVLVSLWIAGLSLFALARNLGASFRGALLGGLAYQFASLFITLLLRYWIPASFAWVPLLLLFSTMAHRRPVFLAPAAGALALAFLDGFFQSSATIVLAWGTFLLAWGWIHEGWRGVWRAVGLGIAIFVLGFALSAVMWLPQLEFFAAELSKGSARAAGRYYGKDILQRILSVPLLVGALFPEALGTVRTMDLTKLAKSNLQDFSLYLGTLPLLLGLACGWASRPARAFWVLVALGLIVPIATPLDRFVYFRFFSVYLLGMAVLAAFGFDRAEAGDRRVLGRVAAVAAFVMGAIAALAAGVRVATMVYPGRFEAMAREYVLRRAEESTIGSRNPEWFGDRAEAFVRFWSFRSADFWLPLVIATAAVVLALAWARAKVNNRIFYPAALAVTLLQLGLFTHGWHGFHSLERFPLFPDNEVARFLRENEPHHQFRAMVNDHHGMRPKELQIVPANTNLAFGYSTFDGFEGMRPPVVNDVAAPFKDYAALARLNVKYLITNPEPPLVSSKLRLKHKGVVAIYEIADAKPRGQVFFSYAVAPAREIWSEINATGLRDGTVMVEEAPSGLASSSIAPLPAELLGDRGNSVSYRFDSPFPGIFVASETFYPGWRAFLNGTEVPLLRANHVMRGVVVPVGKGTIEFRFDPPSFRYGAWISTGALLVAIALVLLRRRLFGDQ